MGVVWGNVLGNIFYVITAIIVANVFGGFIARRSYKHIIIALIVTVIGSIFVSRTEFAIIFLPIQIIEIVVVLRHIYADKLRKIIGLVILFIVIHATILQIIEAFLIALQIIINIHFDGYFPLIESIIILVVLLILFLERNKTLWGTGQIKKKYIYILTSILVIDNGMLVLIGDYISQMINSSDIVMAAMNYILIVIVILIEAVAIIYLISSRDSIKEREELTKAFMEEQRKYYEDIIRRDEKTKKFRHDLKNHMNLLAQFCKEKDIESISGYLEEINIHINEFGSKINTNNSVADVILNRYSEECNRDGIELDIKGHFQNNCGISTFDMCTILSNLLDNAIRAEKESGKRRISFVIRNSDDNELIIKIENDIKIVPQIQNGKIISSKKNKEKHGFGIENVKECVEKNHGYIKIETEEGKFRVWICMDNSGIYNSCSR